MASGAALYPYAAHKSAGPPGPIQLSARRSSGLLIRRFGLGALGFGRMLCRSLGLCRLRVGGLRGSIRLGICMPDVGRFGRARFVVLAGIFGLGLCIILLS